MSLFYLKITELKSTAVTKGTSPKYWQDGGDYLCKHLLNAKFLTTTCKNLPFLAN